MNKIKIFLRTFLLLSFLILGQTVTASPLDIDEQQGFGSGGEIPSAFNQSSRPKTPTELAIKIINIALSFLGILLICLLLYAGFLWMTAAGDESKVEKAMGIIKTSIIGLVIIFAAWSISYFVIQKLDESTGGSKNIRIL